MPKSYRGNDDFFSKDPQRENSLVHMPKCYRGNIRVISLWIFQKENAHENAHTKGIIIREACNCYFIKLQGKIHVHKD